MEYPVGRQTPFFECKRDHFFGVFFLFKIRPITHGDVLAIGSARQRCLVASGFDVA